MTTVHVVVPEGVADPSRPSGGNTYGRRVCAALDARGWSVVVHEAPGQWPHANPAAHLALGRTLAQLSDDALVLLDGLVASSVPHVLAPEQRRLRQVVVVHLPLGVSVGGGMAAGSPEAGRTPAETPGVTPGEAVRRADEGAVLRGARAVIATSAWTAQWLRTAYALEHGSVHLVPPGADSAPLAGASRSGERLICVGALTAIKGHDVLVEALALDADLDWSCRLVGSPRIEPVFVEALHARARAAGVDHRLEFTGPVAPERMSAVYADADLLLVPSRMETFGMAAIEALARGIPVLGSAVGGLPEAVGESPSGDRPGLLTPPGNPALLARELRRWLSDADLRRQLRAAARGRSATIGDWSATADRLARVLTGVSR